jgi:hypothetical protein
MKEVRGKRGEIQVVKVGQVADALGDGLQLVVVEEPVGKVRDSQRKN